MEAPAFLLQQETYQIIGVCMEVQKTLGFGFSEIIYKDAMEIEFCEQHIPFKREEKYRVLYKNHQLPHHFNVDFTCFNEVIIEVKSNDKGMCADHVAQLLNYLKVSGNKIGLLVNFGKRKLSIKDLS